MSRQERRVIYVDDETWQRWRQSAERTGVTISELLRRAATRWIEGTPKRDKR